MGRFARVLAVRPGEGRLAALLVGLMFATSAGGSVGGNAIEALLYARFGVQSLPYLYVALGTVSVLTTFLITALLARVARERLYAILPLAIAAGLVLERVALLTAESLLYPLLWLLMNVMGSLQSLFTWGLAGLVCDTRQAKRLFPLFAAGGILGAVVGGFGTRVLAEVLRSENLLLVWAAANAVAFAAASVLVRGRRAGRPRRTSLVDDLARGFRSVRSSNLMRWMVVPTVLFSLLYFSIAFPFSRAATAEFPEADALAGFLGIFQGVTTAAAFLVSLFVANRVFSRIGIMAAILAFTLVYLAGFGVLAVLVSFPLLVAVRFAQLLWLDGVASSAYQAMFNVLPPERRDQTRAFLDGVPGQAGTILAGLVLVVGSTALAPSQLYVLGLVAAAVATYFVWRASRAYGRALVDALRAGMPQLFFVEDEPFGGFRRDAAAVAVVLEGMRDRDAATRRIAAEILGHLAVPESTPALLAALDDDDRDVRVAAMTALAASDFTVDPVPLEARLADSDPSVRARAAVALLRRGAHAGARTTIAALLTSTDPVARVEGLTAVGDTREVDSCDVVLSCLDDPEPSVRRAAARVAPRVCGAAALVALSRALGDADRPTRDAVAEAIASLGPDSLPAVLDALDDARFDDGALMALEGLPATSAADRLRAYAGAHVREALRYHDLSLAAGALADDAGRLLAEWLAFEARRHASRALRAQIPLGDRDAIALALRALDRDDVGLRANAAETLESVGDRELARPLLRLWEPESSHRPPDDGWLATVAHDPAPWIAECAAFVAARLENGGGSMQTLSTLPTLARVIRLRRVPLFAGLPPTDLKQVATIAREQLFSDGDVLCRQGDVGEELFVIVSGDVRVVSGDSEIARRHAGEFVGEMSIISGEPRAATVIAAGDVRALSIDRESFEGLLRERPETALAVTRVLAQRLRELSR